MYVSVILSIISLASAKRTPVPKQQAQVDPGLCSFFDPESKAALQIPVCPAPNEFGGLHFICGEWASTDAAQVCETMGWRLAMLQDGNNTESANGLAFLCKGYSVSYDYVGWIGGYNGLAADPCMVIDANEKRWTGAYSNLGIQFCQTERMGIFCQDPVVVVETETAGIVTTTVPSGTSSVVVTTVKHHNHRCPCSSSSSSSDSCDCHCNCSRDCDKKKDKNCIPCPPEAVEKSCGPRRQSSGSSSSSSESPDSGSSSSEDSCLPADCHDCDRTSTGSCTKVCDAASGNIRVLQKQILAENAAEECRNFGWSLLDMISAQEAEIAQAMNACFPGYKGGWANSFNGISSNCTFLELLPGYDRVSPQFLVGGDFCEGTYYVFCQTGCPNPLGMGPDIGSVSVSVTVTTPITTIYTPTTTVTVTTTIFDKKL